MTAPSREPTEAMHSMGQAIAELHRADEITKPLYSASACAAAKDLEDHSRIRDHSRARAELAPAVVRALAEQDTAARLAGRLEGFAEAREMAAQTAENAVSNVDSRGHWSDPSRDEIAREIRALSVTPPEPPSEKENERG